MENQISNVKKTSFWAWVWKGRKELWFIFNPPCETIIVFKYFCYSNTYFIQILIYYSNTYFIQILILFKYLFIIQILIYYSNTYLLFKYLFLFIIQILIFFYYSNNFLLFKYFFNIQKYVSFVWCNEVFFSNILR